MANFQTYRPSGIFSIFIKWGEPIEVVIAIGLMRTNTTEPIYSAGPNLKVLTASFHEDRKAATVKNQATKITSMTKGIKGKNSVDIICPTAIDPSSISSIAILILVNIKQRSSKMMSNVIPLMIRKTIQVCESSKYDPTSVVNSKPPMSKLLLLPSSVNLNPQ